MKKLFIILFVSILTIVNGFSQSLTVATVNGTSGQLVNVGVTANGLDSNDGGTAVIGIQINVTYLTSIATYVQISNVAAILSSNGDVISSTVNGGTVVFTWVKTDLDVALDIPNGTNLFDITFLGNGAGASALTLTNIELLDASNNVIPNPTLNNGSITFGAAAATTTWNGTGNWYTPANWSNGYPGLSTSAVINSGIVTVDAEAGYTNNLTITAGAGVTLNTSRRLTVGGNLVLASNATSAATGSILINGTFAVTGTTTVNRYLTDDVQHFFAIPVLSASVANLVYPGNSGFMHRYIETTGSWENLWEPAAQLAASNGYTLNYVNPQTVSLTGTLNNDAQYEPILTRTVGQGDGWNLVGNPYPCPIDWTIGAGWTKTNIANSVYIWNNGVYASFVGGVGANGGTQYIPAFQGFFVNATGAPTLRMRKAARTQSGIGTNYMKSSPINVFRMSISNGELSDETVVYMSENASADFDGEYDAYKLFGFNQTATQIYTSSNEVNYSINGQPVVDSLSASLNIRNGGSAGTYSITASGFETFVGDYNFTIKDHETGISYDLKQNNVVSLTLSQGDITDRFTLSIFKNFLSIDDLKLQGVRVYAENNRVFIENCPKSNVHVYSATGALVASRSFGEAFVNNMTLNVPAGIYTVQVVANNGTMSSKLFIK